MDRREYLKILLGGVGSTLLSPLLSEEGKGEEIPLDLYNPFGPTEVYFRHLRKSLKNPSDVEKIIQRLWKSFESNGVERHGIWTLYYTALLWQVSDDPEKRKIAAKAGVELAKKLQEKTKKTDPIFWEASFLGFYALSAGVLNSLQYVPIYEGRLRWIAENDPSFFYGGAFLFLAKMYMKTPPFPVSVGDLKKAKEYIEKARPYQEKKYALFYVGKAELHHLLGEVEEREKTLNQIPQTCPFDVLTCYTYELAMHQAEAFRDAIRTGKYDRYMWDPFLEPAITLIKKRYDPPQLCG